jgi:aminoglycoside/choline kinase family phosphotransferase
MLQRQEVKNIFLANNGLADAVIHKLPADASFRTYDRITHEDKSFILMDAPPEKEDVKPFIKIANFLLAHGISAPEIYASDIENGFLLLEDFGENKYSSVLSATPRNELEELEVILYNKAIDLLVELHKVDVPADIEYYNDDILVNEALQLTKWYIPVLNGEEMDEKIEREFVDIWKQLLPLTRIFPDVLVLRDYHADNLMWLPERSGIKKVGALDFQDAIIGSPIYDIVSLLEDLRRDVSDKLADQMITRYLEASPHILRKDFLAVYSILGAQRNCKIIGFCARKAIKDNNSSYIRMLPRMWKYIERDLRHPLLLPLKNWFDKVLSSQVKKTAPTYSNSRTTVSG